MKSNIFSIILILGLISLISCENELKKPVSFAVSVSADEYTKENDTIVVKSSTLLTFRLTGNPDFISFYSGEAGQEYKNINRTELSENEIDSYLKFASFAQYGTIPGAFKVYISTTFGDLTKDKEEDLKKIQSHDWIDISDKCNLPTTSSTNVKETIVPLGEFIGGPVVIAFNYKPLNNTTVQPTWELQNVIIENVLKKNGSVSILPAYSMGFTPFDIYADKEIAYLPYTVGIHSTNAGIWDLRNISATVPRMRIQSSAAGMELNEDWLISTPLTLNSCLPDKGIGIKNITFNLEEYSYKYDTPGIYEATFVATNGNMDYYSRRVENIVIKVVD